MKTTAVLAPVAVFVYKRHKHTRVTLEALAKNTLANQSDLYVFCDGAKSAADADAVEKTRQIVRKAQGFRSVTIIERQTNFGLARSIITGVTELLAQFDRVIVLEDDLVSSRGFLRFMNDGLAAYEEDPRVFSVTGHTFPRHSLTIPESYPYDTYAGYRCSSWSWGVWRDRWQRVVWDMDYMPDLIADSIAQQAFGRGGADLMPMLLQQYQGKIDSWAIRFAYAHCVNDGVCIYPTQTLIRNVGLDNSGTHTRTDRRFIHDQVDGEWIPRRLAPASPVDATIARDFRAIFDSPEPSKTGWLKRKAFRLQQVALSNLKDFVEARRARAASQISSEVLMVNTLESAGGAARAANRCFDGVSRLYPDVALLTMFKESNRSRVFGLRRRSLAGQIASRLGFLDRLSLLRYPRRKQETFSPAEWANPLRKRIADFKFDILHLHWLGGGMFEVEELLSTDGPVVWTLHDQWAFTGGCHYVGSCENFLRQCGTCPALGSDQANDLSNDLWLRKSNAYSKTDLTIVAPTHWLADIARRSSLFADKPIEVIPNGLNSEVFSPRNKLEAKARLGIAPDRPALLFGAQVISDARKGGDLLAQSLVLIDFPVTLVAFGGGDIDYGNNPHVTVMKLGSITDDDQLAWVYSAVDAFLCPSRIDNLPNTVAEALSCGTPCVAFNVGGLPEMIEHRRNGWLAQSFDPLDFFHGIKWLVQDASPEETRSNARQKAVEEYSLEVMAGRYQALYRKITKDAGL